MQTCATCHSSYDTKVKFCPRDGTALGAASDRPARICPKCKATYQGAKFCPADGSLLE